MHVMWKNICMTSAALLHRYFYLAIDFELKLFSIHSNTYFLPVFLSWSIFRFNFTVHWHFQSIKKLCEGRKMFPWPKMWDKMNAAMHIDIFFSCLLIINEQCAVHHRRHRQQYYCNHYRTMQSEKLNFIRWVLPLGKFIASNEMCSCWNAYYALHTLKKKCYETQFACEELESLFYFDFDLSIVVVVVHLIKWWSAQIMEITAKFHKLPNRICIDFELK